MRMLSSSYELVGMQGPVFHLVENAFTEFSDPQDAGDARYGLNGREFDGGRITVEFAKGGQRGQGGSREYLGKGGPPPRSGRCFNCGIDGHWARDCKGGDWKNKCYHCWKRGHIETNCQSSLKKLKRERSYSRSASLQCGRSRSRSFSLSHSYGPTSNLIDPIRGHIPSNSWYPMAMPSQISECG